MAWASVLPARRRWASCGWDAFGDATVVAPQIVADKEDGPRARILAGKAKVDRHMGVDDPDFRYPTVDVTYESEHVVRVGELATHPRFGFLEDALAHSTTNAEGQLASIVGLELIDGEWLLIGEIPTRALRGNFGALPKPPQTGSKLRPRRNAAPLTAVPPGTPVALASTLCWRMRRLRSAAVSSKDWGSVRWVSRMFSRIDKKPGRPP